MAEWLIPGVGLWTDRGSAGEYLVPGSGVVTQTSGSALGTRALYLDALLQAARSATAELDAILEYLPESTAELDAILSRLGVTAGAGLDAVIAPPWWSVPPPDAQTIYRLILTGTDDGLPDVELPMSSFQSRARSGAPTYLQVVIPDALTYADVIAARPNGDMQVYRGIRLPDGTEYLQLILTTDVERLDLDWGGRSASATLTGYRQRTNTTPARVELRGVSYRQSRAGTRTIRCVAETFLRAGDIAVFPELGGEELVANVISWTVGRASERMDVSERDESVPVDEGDE